MHAFVSDPYKIQTKHTQNKRKVIQFFCHQRLLIPMGIGPRTFVLYRNATNTNYKAQKSIDFRFDFETYNNILTWNHLLILYINYIISDNFLCMTDHN